MTTVLIAGGGTGGHLMPALAIAERLRERHPAWRVVLVGAERGVEARLLPARGLPFHLLPAEPIYRRQWWKNIRWPVLALRLVRRVDRLLAAERPGLVIGTGGYAAGPVVWRAARQGIPTAILEQDAIPGLATRLLARTARHVYLAVPEARARLRTGPAAEVFVTGAPITSPDPGLRSGARERFGLDQRPVLLVTGGSQGSLALNQVVASWVEGGGSRDLQVLWATGPLTWERFRHLHAPPGVQVFDFLDPIAPAYAAADLAVTRAGSMTLAELCAWGIPAVLVPLPTSAADHQTRNARTLAEAGGAVLLLQRDLTPHRLGAEVLRIATDPNVRATLSRAATARGKPSATAEIVAHLGHLTGPG
jgi:UDP-N-acetylglucosamine--N-acetylmuramyl-(pentapeptide) pyrophosphoryl-undecaprenol N-acetylglucosamine transferase